jgi:hypothetical protein
MPKPDRAVSGVVLIDLGAVLEGSKSRQTNMGSNWVHPILHQAESDHWNWSEGVTAGITEYK